MLCPLPAACQVGSKSRFEEGFEEGTPRRRDSGSPPGCGGKLTGMFSGITGGVCGRLSSAKQLISDTGSWCSLVSTLDCQSRGRGFESRRARQ